MQNKKTCLGFQSLITALIIFTSVSGALGMSISASAKDRRNGDAVTTSRSSADSSSPNVNVHGPERFGLGFQTTHSSFGAANVAISAWLQFASLHSLQLLAAIGGTKGDFQFGAGGLYRFTLFGNAAGGFHIGTGIELGTIQTGLGNKFFACPEAILGFHFQLPELRNILFSFDGGPRLYIVSDDTSFSLTGMSPAAGFSVHYLF